MNEEDLQLIYECLRNHNIAMLNMCDSIEQLNEKIEFLESELKKQNL